MQIFTQTQDADLRQFLANNFMKQKNEFIKSVIIRFGDYYRSKRKQTEQETYHFQNKRLAVDILTGTYLVYDKDTMLATNESPDAFLSILDGETRGHIKASAMCCKVAYNSNNPSHFYKEEHGFEDGLEVNVFNLYQAPPWRKIVLSSPPELPPLFKKFINHFFVNEESRKYFFQWAKYMLIARNNTALTMITDPGTGKNTCSAILKALVGDSNYSLPRNKLFEGQFNYQICYKQLVYFDETIIDDNAKEVIKLILNDEIEIERKGQDPFRAQNFASYVFSNNQKNSNRINHKDRRFSIPDITDVPLLDVFTHDEIREFRDILSDPHHPHIAQIGHWILQYDISDYKDTPYKGDTYDSLIFSSLRDWERFLIGIVMSKNQKEYVLADIKQEYKMEYNSGFGGPSLVETFFKGFSDRDGDKVADTERRGTALKILPTKKYWPEEEKNKASIEVPKDFNKLTDRGNYTIDFS